MRLVRSVRSVFALAFLVAVPASATPVTFSTSGYVLDAQDAPLTRAGASLAYSLWTDPQSSGASDRVWPATGESACVADLREGYYAVVLDGSLTSGCGAGLSAEHFAAPVYLQVSLEGVPLLPRLRAGLLPASWAAHSADAQALAAAIGTSGTINAGTNPVDWTQLKNVPAGLADGSDDGATYTASAGGGLSLTGNAFAIGTSAVTNAMLANPAITVTAGAGLTGGGTAALGAATTLSLPDTVAPGSFTNAAITVDAKGRITAAASGAAPGTVTSVVAGAGLTGGTITGAGTLAIATDETSLAKVSGGLLTAASSRLGIGSATPGSRLDVRVATQTSDGLNLAGADNHGLLLSPSRQAGGSNPLVQAGDASIIYSNGTIGTGALVIAPWNAAAGGLRLDASGKVGIGTATPASTLDVNGSLHVTGATNLDAPLTGAGAVQMVATATCIARSGYTGTGWISAYKRGSAATCNARCATNGSIYYTTCRAMFSVRGYGEGGGASPGDWGCASTSYAGYEEFYCCCSY